MAIIKSLLDSDLYKLTQMQAVFHQFPKVEVKYKFVCRNDWDTVKSFPIEEIKKEIKKLTKLKFTNEEIEYLKSLNLFKEDFLNYLKKFKLSFSAIKIDPSESISSDLELTISGLWLETILFEVPVLAIINELYSRRYSESVLSWNIGVEKLCKNIKLINVNNAIKDKKIQFIEFGTRRRYSFEWQEYVIKNLKKAVPENLIGTSNVYFAKKYNLKPIGTMAHEWIQAGLSFVPTKDAQIFMLDKWRMEYPDKLKTALTDTFGLDAFLNDFDKIFMEHYNGLRQDSGDPFEFINKVYNHYVNNGCDIKHQKLLFSDNLDFKLAYKILNYKPTLRYKKVREPINFDFDILFGIGTHLTNNLLIPPLNIVIKMVECNGQPVCKLSDSLGKEICDDENYLNYVKEVFGKK
ncbi:MAG: nicotinate phosphoribosyltransferase [Candidatus Nanoarchaeia archaeon]|nr:nicotinate phosphoribosyltransferase [Candidatus Nanoarchaeia archaeon]